MSTLRPGLTDKIGHSQLIQGTATVSTEAVQSIVVSELQKLPITETVVRGGVTSFNGLTGAVTGVSSFEGLTGAVNFDDYVVSVNGITGYVGISAGAGTAITITGNTLCIEATASGTATEDTIGFFIDTTPDDVSTGSKGFKRIAYDAEVLEWSVFGGQTGSISVDLKKSSYGTYDSFTTFVGGDNPRLVSQIKNQNTGVTAWGGLSAGDLVEYVIDSNTGIQKVGVFVKIRRLT
jgi:hypothetical protein